MIKRNYNRLFLDRDGVINTRLIGDYVKNIDEFEFIDGALEAIKIFAEKFETIVIVTNQQGIGKGLMSYEDLDRVHSYMMEEINKDGGRIDKIYFAEHLAKDEHIDRKPGIGMGLKARKDFEGLRFKDSIMVGDSITDMMFGKRLNMKTVFICDTLKEVRDNDRLIDNAYSSLIEFARTL